LGSILKKFQVHIKSHNSQGLNLLPLRRVYLIRSAVRIHTEVANPLELDFGSWLTELNRLLYQSRVDFF
jgi:hypothetical protein